MKTVFIKVIILFYVSVYYKGFANHFWQHYRKLKMEN